MSLNTLKALRVGRIAKRENRCWGSRKSRWASLGASIQGPQQLLSVLRESHSVESPVIVRSSWCEKARAGGGEIRQRSAEALDGGEKPCG